MSSATAQTTMKKRERSTNWTEPERIILVQLVIGKENDLFGNFKGSGQTAKSREAVWDEIVRSLNAEANVKRTSEQVKKQFDNIKQLVKRHLDSVKHPATGGGRGPAPPTPSQQLLLSHWEGRPGMEGIQGGIDTAEIHVDEELVFNTVSLGTVLDRPDILEVCSEALEAPDNVMTSASVDVQPSPVATVTEGAVLWLTCTYDLDGGTLGQLLWRDKKLANVATATPTATPQCSAPSKNYSVDCNNLASNEVRLGILRPVDGDTYSCSFYFSNATLIGPVSTQVSVVVPVPSVTCTSPVSDKVTVTPGGSQVYTCVTGSCRPPARIDWYKDGVNVTSQAGTVSIDEDSFVTTSSVTLTGARGDNSATVQCRASNVNGIDPVQSDTKVFVVEWAPDGPPVISGYTDLTILYTNDVLSLSCRQQGGNPQPTLTWIGKCGRITARDGSSGNEAVSDITITKGYNQATCVCMSTHPEPQTPDRSQVTFTVHYAPDNDTVLTGYTEGQILYEGSPDLSLTCTQEGGNPLATITWNCVGQSGTSVGGSSSQTTSTVQVPRDRDINRKSCTCTARSPDTNITFDRSASVIFTIYYAPPASQLPSMIGYTSGEVIYEGDPAKSVQCHQIGGFPLATLTWDCFGLGGTNTSTDSESTSRIQLSSNSNYNGRNCTCTATHPDSNVMYRRSVYVTVTVYYAPDVDPVITGYTEGQILYEESPDLSLTCTQEGGHPLATITWNCVGQSGTSVGGSSTQTTSTVQVPRDRNINRKSCTCTARSPDTNITFDRSTSVIFTIYYAPAASQLPSITGYTSGEVLYEGDPAKSVQCHQIGGFPLTTLTWDCFSLSGTNTSTDSESTSRIQLSSNRSHNGRKCSCTAAHPDSNVVYRRSVYVTVTVYYPPIIPVIRQTPTHPWLAGDSGTLICNYSEGFPAPARIEWSRDGNLQTGQSTNSVNLTPLTPDDNQAGYSCRVSNNFTDTKLTNRTSPSSNLNVEFKPLVTLTATQLTVVEGKTAHITCEALGNPTPTVQWLRGESTVSPEGSPASDNLTLDDVDRSATDNYTCRAEGVSTVQGRQLVTERRASILVHYPPDVTLTVPHDVEEGNTSVRLMCQTIAEPNTLTSQSWTQTIDQSFITDQFTYETPATKDTIALSEVSLEDTGTYTCTVSNGIVDRQGQILQSNSTVLNVRVAAKFNTSEQNPDFYSKLHEPVTVKIPFYSNPPVKSTADFNWAHLTPDGRESALINATFDIHNGEDINLSIKGRTVKFSGQAAVMNLSSFEQSYAGTYNITVYNDGKRRQSMTTFSISPSGPPETSTNFKDTDATSSSITVKWTKGFNGGHSQTFVILYGPATEGFKQSVSVKERQQSTYTEEVTDLKPNTRYQLNMYAYNEEGNSSLSGDNNIIRKTEEAEKEGGPGSVAAIAGGAGGSFAALLIIAAVAIVLYRRRNAGRGKNSCQRSDAALVENSDDSEEDGLKMNILYESAGPYRPENQNDGNQGGSKEDYTYAEVNKKSNVAGAAYAEVIPKKDRKAKATQPEESGDIYAQVQKNEKAIKQLGKEKKKKVEKGKKKQKKTDDEYQSGSVYKNVGAVGGKTEELYANTDDATIPKERNPSRKKNKDGLIYLDLEFKKQQNGTRQAVIHGIENRNDYAVVDFTQHADPLPDEDTEEKDVASNNN